MPENFITMDAAFPGLKTVQMEENFRSTSTIIEAATSVITQGKVYTFEKKINYITLKIKYICRVHASQIPNVLQRPHILTTQKVYQSP